jgi:hypothetical protein
MDKAGVTGDIRASVEAKRWPKVKMNLTDGRPVRPTAPRGVQPGVTLNTKSHSRLVQKKKNPKTSSSPAFDMQPFGVHADLKPADHLIETKH